MSQLLGDTTGLKKKEIRLLEKLMQRTVPADEFVSPALAEEICTLSLEISHPLTVLLDRAGRVYQVFVGSVASMGESGQVAFPRKVSGTCGIRAISTQADSMNPPSKSALTSLLQYRLDALVTLVASQNPQWSLQFGEHPKACDACFITTLQLDMDNRLTPMTQEPVTLYQLEKKSFEDFTAIIDYDLSRRESGTKIETREKAFLIGLAAPGPLGKHRAEDLLDELALLAKTAGAVIVGRSIQTRSQPDPNFYIGKGKAQELAFEVQQLEADIIIADDELLATQQRALERVLRTRVVDRTELILDIFAQRAQSWEGKIQVELAQLQYKLPRLAGRGHGFSQQTAGAKGGGGIATRGPGETKLELDRRRLRTRITELERQAEQVRKHRQLQRKDRMEKGLPIIALVGYTNAGKSTLLNTLTKAGTLSEDKLFATLDPLARRLVRPGLPECLVVDTVGFIQKLPTTLVKAFRSTLEEVQSATLIFHVADLSHPDRIVHFEAVQETLLALECESTPQWILLNKIDQVKHLDEEMHALEGLLQEYSIFPISAKTGEGLPALLDALQSFLQASVQSDGSGVAHRSDSDASIWAESAGPG